MLKIPYIVPLFLGMTYDARNSAPGVAIFDDIKDPTEYIIKETATVYTIATDNISIRNALGISGEMALKIKLGNLDVRGSGSYLKIDEDMRESVLLLVKFKHLSRLLKLEGIDPIPGWASKFNKEILGTHYVNDVIYGVEMVAAVKFTAKKTSSKQEIAAKIIGIMQSSGRTVTDKGGVEGKLDTINRELKDLSSMEISYFGTLPLRSVPTTLEGVKDLIDNFTYHVEEAGLLDGLPMEVQLRELAHLKGGGSQFRYDIQSGTQSAFKRFLNGYLGLSEARDYLFSWSRSLPLDLSDASSEKIGRMMEELNNDLNDCYKIISEVDLSGDSSVLDSAVKKMWSKLYRYEVDELIKEIDEEVGNMTTDVTTAIYIHWGRTECPGNFSTKIITGHAIGASTDGVGGMAQYDCMEDAREGNTYELSDEGLPSEINNVTYVKVKYRANPFKGNDASYMAKEEYRVPCSKCHQEDASIVSMFSATTICPPLWDLKYTGLLMSAPMLEGHTTEYLCIDDTPPRMSKFTNTNKSPISLTLVGNGGSLPENYKNERTVPCVVCAMKGGRLF